MHNTRQKRSKLQLANKKSQSNTTKLSKPIHTKIKKHYHVNQKTISLDGGHKSTSATPKVTPTHLYPPGSSLEMVHRMHQTIDEMVKQRDIENTGRTPPEAIEEETRARQSRQSLSNKARNEAMSAVEYSAVTTVNVVDNSEHNTSTPQEVITMSRIDRYCDDDTKEAAQFGVQYENEMDCKFPSPRTNKYYNNTTTKSSLKPPNPPLHTTSNTSRRHMSTKHDQSMFENRLIYENLNIIDDVSPSQSIFNDPLIYGSFNFISDITQDFKHPSELKEDFFEGDYNQLRKAVNFVQNFQQEQQVSAQTYKPTFSSVITSSINIKSTDV